MFLAPDKSRCISNPQSLHLTLTKSAGIMIILGILISSGVVVVKIFSSRSEEDIRRMSSVFEPRRSSISSRRSSGNSYRTQTNSLRAESIRDLQDM